MRPDSPRRFLHGALLLTAAAHVLFFIAVALARRAYPFELEWMEGGVVEHVRRVLAGQPLYVRPSLGFTPFLYAPFYYYAGAAVSAATAGAPLAALRAISFAATLGSFAAVLFLARREAGALAGALAAGLFAAAYVPTGAWFDLARGDMTFLCLTLGGIAALCGSTAWRAALAAALLAAAVFTKQAALGPTLALALHVLVVRRGPARWIFPGLASVLIVGGAWVAQRSTDGWFGYYAFALPRQFAWGQDMRLSFWTRDLWPFLPAFGAAVAYALGRARRGNAFPAVVLASLVLTSWHARNHLGAAVNALIPACAGIAIYAAAAVGKAWEEGGRRAILIGTLALAQGCVLLRGPSALLPTPEDRRAGEGLAGLFRQVPGEIFAPAFGYLVARAGKAPQAHMMAIADVMRDPAHPEYGRALQREIDAALEARRYDLVVLNTPWLLEKIHPGYVDKGAVFPDPGVFYPRVGTRTRPDRWFVKR